MTGDLEGVKFLHDLKPVIQKGNLSMVSELIQLDQHDFAVRKRLTRAEHRCNLDVPSWEERPRQALEASGAAEALAAAVR
jgi:hypothetical protein